ncbi:signal transduction histidine kinase [Trueperella bonasi]|uniref:histidine kinase n=1 Tax=Trueperella bonasi TaxID=312286 RepID=A0ABT9NF64_9ACTO|nr:HAMP domain-containing sensor histidine kinase [Trueperella bonasi]MDP9805845.1 signal transduction histidine kinase [Trueperella bonasi]
MTVLITFLVLLSVGLATTCTYLFFQTRTRPDVDATISEDTKLPAVISHELRTPLTLIRGAAELLAEGTPGTLTDLQQEFVGTILDNSQLAIDIAENLVSNMRLSISQPIFTRVDVRQTIARAVRDMRRFSPATIEVDAPGGLLPIYADSQLIHQLVWNLVNNSVRHAGQNALIRVRVANGENGGLHLRISDNGRGMTPEELKNLFVPFVSGTGRRPGAGIGMMICQKIVEAHSGKIIVDSEPGRGTTFHVALPPQPKLLDFQA